MRISSNAMPVLGLSLILLLNSAGVMAASSSEQDSIKAPIKKEKQDAEGAPKPSGIDMSALKRMLRGDGLSGEVHAADANNRQYVFTYRDPKDFFNFVHIGLATHSKDVLKFFESMHRHDKITIRGDFFHEGEFLPESPQPHIEVTSVSMLKKYEPPVVANEKFRKTTIVPDDLKDKTDANFLVHAVLKDGAFLVLEYKDNFVFTVVPDKKYTENLYRNDRIHMRFKILSFPVQPVHIELDTDTSNGKKPIEVLESIHELHGKQFTQIGHLVRFPKSPQINRDIWAVEQKSEEGNARTFTLVNFKKPGEQEKIDAQLKRWWDSQPDGIIDGRNKLIHSKITIKASGIMNVIDPNQANVQMKTRAKDLSLVK